MDTVNLSTLLSEAGQAIPPHEARALMAHVLGCDLATLRLAPARAIDPRAFRALLARRVAHEPLQLILGSTGFWDLELEVSTATLIPRPDSETLIEAALEFCPQSEGRVLDLGTGTGCLLLAFLHERPWWQGVGIDLAPAAAALAARNSRGADLQTRVAFIAADWAAPIAASFDLILSNPPYIPSADIATLAPEVRDWEPSRALDGGGQGLDAYRAILGDLPRLLVTGGIGVFELGVGQGEDVAAIAIAAGLSVETIRPDLAGIPRALVVRK